MTGPVEQGEHAPNDTNNTDAGSPVTQLENFARRKVLAISWMVTFLFTGGATGRG
jgi:hypothetical protein